jgi:polysaccharide export outer membrane protein
MRSRFVAIPLIVVLAVPLSLFGQTTEYVIGVEDVLDISVWQQPELSTQVTVAADGTITVPPIGSIPALGRTPSQLAQALARGLAAYNPRISQVAVNIVEFNSQRVYVMGQVNNPGRYSFPTIPDLVTVLSEAGGPTETALLSEVMIIGAEAGAERQVVDLERYLRDADPGALPPLKTGDKIFVPQSGPPQSYGRDVISVCGEVVSPGIYNAHGQTHLLEAVLLAGGPTDRADLGKVTILRRDITRQRVTSVSLAQYLRDGAPHSSLILDPGDTAIIGSKSRFWPNLWTGFREILGVATGIASLYLFYDAVRD